MLKIFLRYAQDSAKYSVQKVALLKGIQCQKCSFTTHKIMQNRSLVRVPFRAKWEMFCKRCECVCVRANEREQERVMECSLGLQNFLRYAQNNAKYNVQRVAFLRGTQCQKCSFTTHKIMQNLSLVRVPFRAKREMLCERCECVCESEREGTGEEMECSLGMQNFLRYAQNNAKYSVQRVAFLKNNAMSKNVSSLRAR